jgi:hypothetical protein
MDYIGFAFSSWTRISMHPLVVRIGRQSFARTVFPGARREGCFAMILRANGTDFAASFVKFPCSTAVVAVAIRVEICLYNAGGSRIIEACA